MANIENALRDFNPWWREPFHIEFREREAYEGIREYLPSRFALALTGLRRVGKTTLLHRLAEDSIREGADPRSIAYFAFDLFPEVGLEEVLHAVERVSGRALAEGRSILLLDEVQKVEGWASQLKVLYDRPRPRHAPIKFVVSGSESLFLRKGSRETLAGRLLEFPVHPLTFAEYLAFRGIDPTPVPLRRPELRRALGDFGRSMGFPELVGQEDRGLVRRYVHESVVGRVLYRDLPRMLRVRDPAVLESVLNILREEPGQIVDVSSLARDLGISRNSMSTYLGYLEGAFLVRKLYNFAAGRRKVERKLKKLYPAMPAEDLPFGTDELSRARTLEWLVVTQLRAEFFWRDAAKNEVDIVLPTKPPVPIEVKSGKVETRGLLAFLKRHRGDTGYVVTHDREETLDVKGKTIHVVPAFRFLLERPDLDASGAGGPRKPGSKDGAPGKRRDRKRTRLG